jgi:hypothetical protein
VRAESRKNPLLPAFRKLSPCPVPDKAAGACPDRIVDHVVPRSSSENTVKTLNDTSFVDSLTQSLMIPALIEYPIYFWQLIVVFAPTTRLCLPA